MAKKRNISAVILPFAIASGVIGGIFIGKYEAVRKLSPGQEKCRQYSDLSGISMWIRLI